MTSSQPDGTVGGPGINHVRVLALVRRFGCAATSFQVLEPGYKYFFLDDACVAYVDTGSAWVAAGPPLADDAHMAAVAHAFVEAARSAGRRTCFFGIDERSTRILSFRRMLIGKQAHWNPGRWTETVREARSLREQLRRARAKGVRVRTVPFELTLQSDRSKDAAIGRLVERWHQMRDLAPMGFLARVKPWPTLPDQVLFAAEQEGRLVGLLLVAPIFGRRGWLLQNLLRAPEAPNGTAETLVDHAMREAVARGQALVTLGLAPLAGQVSRPLRLARVVGSSLYNFDGLFAFKAKLRPERWEDVFVSFPSGTSPVRAIVDVLAAFAPRGLLRFGLRTLMRGPSIVVSLLAFLLVPWTVLLSTLSSSRWFPHPIVKWSWVGFDALLVTGLFALRTQWRDRLARGILAAICLDAVVTLIEDLWWNLPRAAGLVSYLALAIAAAAPSIAFLVLSRAVTRRSDRQVGIAAA